MTLSKEKAGALCFLVLAIAYGMEARHIPLFPGDELEPFTARTMPIALSWLTGIVSFLLLVLPQREETDDILSVFRGLNWGRTSILIGLMVFYGLTLSPLGFLLSTVLFLIGGIYALGERRWSVILLSSVPATVGFWFILDKLLGIYLAPGEIFAMLGAN
ncbi:tripartite tricarboxylate transporter TctB family protein [Kiloniella majae]|uniref:tripartite tricarboxylate transporter TctB family protein n=1 Tax=Kiloniella majae TaxID=1938558 RepID=UPI000A277CD4|nr:tripartite tricarboxylate transporter TctB family protein [Kiloniella majae]